ncbi:hypothetical protein EPUS_02219 [Endocarpon pusillum Z07020]|uniref:OPT family small oligopeptide transporter n=1 Tax=Endocarpon pusillum (strain Z07020 / HMAS-L-300199) TaxID=1263415 RepID=U1I0G0_ENDPU|nr:uncharacterized protein EPUS_02219 [Endocarpon pusillum Z07020]ERF76680.1 hypothetical protein EPUS_02219 [Endocarpon pusillum Z07020]
MDGSPLQQSVEPIPLRTLHRSACEDVVVTDDASDELEVYPDTDVALPRHHGAHAANTSGDTLTSAVVPQTVLERFIEFVMSNSPLLVRSSPSIARDSYGAMPSIRSRRGSTLTHSSDDEADDIRKRDKRKPVRTSTSAGRMEASLSTPDLGRQHIPKARPRGRATSQTSEVGMGMESKTSFAGGGPLPQRFMEPVSGPSSFSSAASSRESSSKRSNRRRYNEDDPPDNSPYPEVRASVRATDDTTLSISTPRMWTLSLLFALAGSATNLFFSLRYPSVAITPVIALVLVHPLGKLWDLLLKQYDDPEETFIDGIRQSMISETYSLKHRFRLWLAQGRWNEKEHACVYISSNVSFGFAFATDVIVEQHKFYKQDVSVLYQILLTISTQILGYAFAGLTRRFLVRPAAMIWPGTLMSTAMFTTMHKQENEPANGWIITRYKFFVYVWLGAFAWYFLPGLLFPALSYFNVVTWFAPENVVVANLFGVVSGLGLFPMTFDWAQIAYIGSPLLTPWWAAANVVGGLVLVMWVIAPILYYRNTLFSSYLPILSTAVFDNTGKPYDVARILTPDFLFDEVAYEAYSRVYLPITYVLSYGVQFASLTALVTHTACWYGRDIWRQSKKAFLERYEDEPRATYQPIPAAPHNNPSRQSTDLTPPSVDGMISGAEDVHCRLMRRYPDAPLGWYLVTFVLMTLIGIFVVEYYPVYLPWWGLLLALGITSLLFIPVGIVMAITNQHSSLYLVCQLIAGYLFPGAPVANMVFVTYSYISSAQGIKFSSDLKLGHYMKIPPRLLFSVQMLATLRAINGFTCPLARVHFNGSILWGVVGPARFFGRGALYRPLIWAFLIGAIAPIGVWLIGRRRPKTSPWRQINPPVLFGSLSWIPPASGLNFSVWAVVCFAFNHVVRRRRSEWWAKYTMTMSAALDSGLAFALLIVFFGVVYPGWMEGFRWWGTDVYKMGCDWRACPYTRLGEGEKFGD